MCFSMKSKPINENDIYIIKMKNKLIIFTLKKRRYRT